MGCTQNIPINLEPSIPNSFQEINIDLCAGESYTYDGIDYSESGTYELTYTNTVGCDSLVTLNIFYYPSNHTEDLTELCYGELYDGQIYFESVTTSTTMTDQNGCDSTHTVSIIVNPQIEVTIDSRPNCDDYSSQYHVEAIVTGGTGNLQYLWSTGDTIPTLDLDFGDYSLTVTDEMGCPSTALISLPFFMETDTTEINTEICDGEIFIYNNMNFEEAGSHIFTFTNTFGCDSIVVLNIANAINISGEVIDVTCAGEADGSIYNLIIEGGIPPYSWTDNTAFENLNAGDYEVMVIDSTNCSRTVVFTIDEPTPLTATTTQTPEMTNQMDGSASIQVSGGITPYTYLWSTGATSDSINNVAAGIYEVTVTDANDCQLIVMIEVEMPTNVFTPETTKELFQIMPNPFNQWLHIENLQNIDIQNISLINAIGQEPYKKTIINTQNTDLQLNTSQLAAGIYILTIKTEKGIYPFKVIKSK